MNPNPNKETPEQELRERAGSDELIEFMQSSGFNLTSSEHNTYGFWFNEKDQMTVGLVQAEYMFKLFATHYKAREAEIELRAEAKTLQWVEDLGIEATESCSVHDMNEYHQKFGEGVSFKVHTRLLDEVLPKLELLSKESSS